MGPGRRSRATLRPHASCTGGGRPDPAWAGRCSCSRSLVLGVVGLPGRQGGVPALAGPDGGRRRGARRRARDPAPARGAVGDVRHHRRRPRSTSVPSWREMRGVRARNEGGSIRAGARRSRARTSGPGRAAHDRLGEDARADRPRAPRRRRGRGRASSCRSAPEAAGQLGRRRGPPPAAGASRTSPPPEWEAMGKKIGSQAARLPGRRRARPVPRDPRLHGVAERRSAARRRRRPRGPPWSRHHDCNDKGALDVNFGPGGNSCPVETRRAGPDRAGRCAQLGFNTIWRDGGEHDNHMHIDLGFSAPAAAAERRVHRPARGRALGIRLIDWETPRRGAGARRPTRPRARRRPARPADRRT